MVIDMDVCCRTATLEDAPALCAIYAPYVENTFITFEYEVPSVEDFASRIRNTLVRYPYLVAETDGRIAGYAYASPFKGRAAYDWSAEVSIYLSPDFQGQGIGRLLYEELERILKRQQVRNLCACIAYPHPASCAFHAALGYKEVAHFTASGYKQGAWHDMIWMEKQLLPHDVPPTPFIPFPELD